MLLLSNNVSRLTASLPSSASWLAAALTTTIVSGCSGLQSNVIDYTLTEEQYQSAVNPQDTVEEPELLAALPQDRTETESITLAAAPEPTMAAALPPAPELPAASVKPPALKPMEQTSVTAAEAAANAIAFSSNPYQPVQSQAPVQSQTTEPKLGQAFDRKTFIDRLKFSPSVYTAIDFGVSRLNPDPSRVPGWSVDDRIAGAGQIGLGVDIAKRLSVELHSADYGSAGLVPEGRVNYHMHGISALIYAGKDLDRYRRRGLNGYARVGFNLLENTPVGNIPFTRQTSQHGSFGLGAEYNTRLGLGFRADVVAYDGDVQSGRLGVLYRFGLQNTKPKLAAATPAEMPAPLTESPAEPAMAAAKPKMMAAPEISYQPTHDFSIEPVTASQPVSAPGDACTALNGTLNNVNFQRGSSRLTRGSAVILTQVADTLQGCAHRNVSVSAHTDNNGDAGSNIILSRQRAKEVAMFLARRGISSSRIRAIAYGESQPIASNNTLDGRMRNRRVELIVE